MREPSKYVYYPKFHTPVYVTKQEEEEEVNVAEEEEQTSTEMELATSAQEMEDQFRSEGLARISTAQAEIMEEEFKADQERKIVEHYEKRAGRLMEELWKKCGKATQHKRHSANRENGYMENCEVCLMPLVRNTDGKMVKSESRAKEGISKVANQLRAADVKAGIEWIP